MSAQEDQMKIQASICMLRAEFAKTIVGDFIKAAYSQNSIGLLKDPASFAAMAIQVADQILIQSGVLSLSPLGTPVRPQKHSDGVQTLSVPSESQQTLPNASNEIHSPTSPTIIIP